MKKHSPEEAKSKILRYCAYQERSHKEVKNKLFEFGLYSSEVDELVTYLITEGFLNEERFAKAYAGGKFRMKKWGRLKIIRELENHGLTANCIKIGLREIENSDYEETLRDVVRRKNELSEEENLFVRRDKIARYAIQKGFEPEFVWREVKQLLPD
jgi:regulatory protein